MLVTCCMLFIRKHEAFNIKMDDYKKWINIKSHWILYLGFFFFTQLLVICVFSTIWIFHVLNIQPFWVLAWPVKMWKANSFLLNNPFKFWICCSNKWRARECIIKEQKKGWESENLGSSLFLSLWNFGHLILGFLRLI